MDQIVLPTRDGFMDQLILPTLLPFLHVIRQWSRWQECCWVVLTRLWSTGT